MERESLEVLERPPQLSEVGVELRPQPGPQTTFAETLADIAIFGGSAGGGKSYALLMEPLRNKDNSRYAAVIFRRTTPSIRNPGALWDESTGMYSSIGPNTPDPNKSALEWVFPVLPPRPPGVIKKPNDGYDQSSVPGGGAKIKFAHLEYDQTVHDWHGSQVPLICFDELCEFTQKQFFYMLSRNRSACGVTPYVRATCNPDADSWVAEFIAWWIEQDPKHPNYGHPIPERAGVLRWFVRLGDDLRWADDPSELTHAKLGIAEFDKLGNKIPLIPKSVTFIPATLFDNVALMQNDPGYLANLLALATVERERLLKGNWKIKPAAGLHFKRSWILPENWIDAKDLPKDLIIKRGWDLAATEKTQLNDPDFTTGTKMGKAKDRTKDPFTYVIDHTYAQESSGAVEARLKQTAAQDGKEVEQWLPQDPGQAGKSQVRHLTILLDGYPVRATPERGDKLTRFGPFSAAAEAKLVKVVRGPWNERWLTVLEAFDGEGTFHDDDADSTSRAFNAFLDGTAGLIEHYQELARKQVAAAQGAQAQQAKATLSNGGVRVRGPAGVNLLTGLKNEVIFIEDDGTFIVSPDHLKALRRTGQWHEAEEV